MRAVFFIEICKIVGYNVYIGLLKGEKFMAAIALYGSIAASIILYINIVSTMKKIKNNESTERNTIAGCLCTAFITFVILSLCGR